ncbi:MAG: ATP-dependent Clp protease proteolytic subunit, partial [Desulfuromonadales bacterium]|nr:ATP-dependent Clp protease proteolytic subunit [Desulfuromonadales bacterium]
MSSFVLTLLICLLTLPGTVRAETAEAESGVIYAVRVADAINPVVANFIAAELDRANAEDARAFLLELDTPGGLDTAMRTIIQKILGSRLPVIVYVYPSGGRAASAGALILLAADFAAMAPGTNAGAAHPVSLG